MREKCNAFGGSMKPNRPFLFKGSSDVTDQYFRCQDFKASPHWDSVIHRFLDEKFPSKWIVGVEPWYCSTLSLFISSFLVNIAKRVWIAPIHDSEVLKAWIINVVSSVP
ncbi:hypothetical protein AVEN_76718-1 [Araneus ventricosus]|uniref:Uncharacterized protein n=1 Tax=Araneus ventricosus TaxID=182803 RepID=A0A4Y2BP50_ARAVE|nr:hypothetical protein AVEN_76718-1 [Araneus ventricosus]